MKSKIHEHYLLKVNRVMASFMSVFFTLYYRNAHKISSISRNKLIISRICLLMQSHLESIVLYEFFQAIHDVEIVIIVIVRNITYKIDLNNIDQS